MRQPIFQTPESLIAACGGWEELWRTAQQAALDAGAGDEASDVAQDVAIRAHKYVRLGRRITPAWVCSNARTLTMNRQRDDRRRWKYEELYTLKQQYSRYGPVWRHWHPQYTDRLQEVRALLLLLPDKQQEVISHLYFYGYSTREAKQRLRMGWAHLNCLRDRAIKNLRRLAGMGEDAT